jgi:hypothetical protein
MATSSGVKATGFRWPRRKEMNDLRVENRIIGCESKNMEDKKEYSILQQ